MSISPVPSAPQTPARGGALNPLSSNANNTVLTRGKSDKSRNIDREHEWSVVAHTRRCIACNALGPCPCRGLSLPPEEKKRRIEAVLSNTDFARTRQRREAIRLAEQEAKERLFIERREADALSGLGDLEGLFRVEMSQRLAIVRAACAAFNSLARAWESVCAMQREHMRQITSLVLEEEPLARSRISSMEEKDYQLRLDTFVDMCQCLVECLTEQACQREAFCEGVWEFLMDLQDEEDNSFVNMFSMEWQMSMEDVMAITAAKDEARLAFEGAALDARNALEAQWRHEWMALADVCAQEEAMIGDWIRSKAAAREAFIEEALVVMSHTIPAECAALTEALHDDYVRECADRIAWVGQRAVAREVVEQQSLDERRTIEGRRMDELSAMYAQFSDEHACRLAWCRERQEALSSLARSSIECMLALQSQRADEIHAFHDDYLAEHTLRVQWIDEKHRTRARFTSEAEAVMWSIFVASRDEALHLAAAAEEGVSDVLALLREKHNERQLFVQSFESSVFACIVQPEEKARGAIAELFEVEGRARTEWAHRRHAERVALSDAAAQAFADIFADFVDGLSRLNAIAKESAAAIEAWLCACQTQLCLFEAEEAAARALLWADAADGLSALLPSYVASHAASTEAFYARIRASLQAEEECSRSRVCAIYVSAFEEIVVMAERARHEMCHAARQRFAHDQQTMLLSEAHARSVVLSSEEAAFVSLTSAYAESSAALLEAHRAALASRDYDKAQHVLRVSTLRESLSVYGSSSNTWEEPSEDSLASALRGLPSLTADAIASASPEQLEQVCSLIFAYGDHIGSFSNNIDAALRRGGQLLAEEDRTQRHGATLSEQRDFYANKLFTDNATQQAKLVSMRQTVANRKTESKRLEVTLKEAEQEVTAHKKRLEGLKEGYRGKGR